MAHVNEGKLRKTAVNDKGKQCVVDARPKRQPKDDEMKGRKRSEDWCRGGVMTRSNDVEEWWRGGGVTRRSDDEEEWWRGVMTRRRGDEEEWWRGGVTRRSDDEEEWWRGGVMTRRSGDEEAWWRGVVTRSGDEEVKIFLKLSKLPLPYKFFAYVFFVDFEVYNKKKKLWSLVLNSGPVLKLLTIIDRCLLKK